MIKTIAYSLGGLALCVAIFAGVEYSSDPEFWQRYLNPPADPMEPGPDFYQPEFSLNEPETEFFPNANAPTIDPEVLESAAAWTEQTAGTALLVLHRGEIQIERYAITVQRVVGKPIQDYFLERIWRPIGADRGSFFMDRADGMIHIDCCFRTTPHNWIRLGALVLNDGVWNGERVLPQGWVEAMTTPSPRNPNFGLHIWLGKEFVENRAYSELREVGIPHKAPFIRDDIAFFEGGGYRTMYIIPSEDMVILRLGKSHPDWDSSYLPNLLIEGIIAPVS